MVKKLGLLVLTAVLLTSCVSTKRIHYFRGLNKEDGSQVGNANFETKIKPDDNLLIIVSASDPAAAEPFNLPLAAIMNSASASMDIANVQDKFQTYLVNRNGEIDFPVLGKLKLGGLTKDEALTKLNTELTKYISKPIVNMRILNYKVSVLGEVVRPGAFNISSERISLPEALAMAGDLTIYGDRKEILLIRDVSGEKVHYTIDLTSADLINSPCFYLQQNDMLYIKPNKVRVNSAGVGPNTTVIISSISLLLTTIALLTR
ncbi:polysaccharide biosynthesis/export family protein [Flavobacterium sp. RHBU_3]|uniref:polysaccharide biosynthesis/export family protein n=1 Tax=Flavobacterium sp. RHBU_3 TaxID=3391184 RepID=UPI0039846FD6